MRLTPTLLLTALLPLFGGCQLMADAPSDPNIGTTRMQGELRAAGGQLLFKPCSESRTFVINDVAATGILQEAANLAKDANDKLFADVRGRLTGSKQASTDGQLEVRQLYRLEPSIRACEDPNFKQLTLRANGHEPGWDIKASGKGMVLNRIGQPPAPAVPRRASARWRPDPDQRSQRPARGTLGRAATLRGQRHRRHLSPAHRTAHRRQHPAGLRLLRRRTRQLIAGHFYPASRGCEQLILGGLCKAAGRPWPGYWTLPCYESPN